MNRRKDLNRLLWSFPPLAPVIARLEAVVMPTAGEAATSEQLLLIPRNPNEGYRPRANRRGPTARSSGTLDRPPKTQDKECSTA